MNVAQLYRLARTLREIALQAATDDQDNRVPPSQLTVAEDVARHPKTTAQGIVQRTGLVQSQVSTIIALFKKEKIFKVTPAPHDGRKQLIEIDPKAHQAIFKPRGQQSISKAAAILLPNLSETELQKLERLLIELSELVTR